MSRGNERSPHRDQYDRSRRELAKERESLLRQLHERLELPMPSIVLLAGAAGIYGFERGAVMRP
jgi:hypothetical protein